ncbi:MAG: hypothetical protein LBR80_03525 [Deltaproteobacteria bacterium]|nr:hypothetical protein [Deltaproteobacteria bacterium]
MPNSRPVPGGSRPVPGGADPYPGELARTRVGAANMPSEEVCGDPPWEDLPPQAGFRPDGYLGIACAMLRHAVPLPEAGPPATHL